MTLLTDRTAESVDNATTAWDREAPVRQALLDRVAEIAPALAATAQESESISTLSDAAAELLRANGLLRMKVPAEVGGFELSPASQMVVLEALARIDSGAAWVTMVSNTAGAFLGAFLPEEGAAEVFADGADQNLAGVAMPSGKAVRRGSDLVLSGRWRFASGIRQAAWIQAASFVEGEPGSPPVLVAVPRDQVTILDTWQVMGLRATGSCDFELDDVVVPAHRVGTVDFRSANNIPLRGGVMYSLPGPSFVAYEHCAMSLGMGQRALDRMAKILRDRRAGLPEGVVEREMVVAALGRCQIALDAARNESVRVQQLLFEEALAGGVGAERVAQSRAVGRYATDVALDAARSAFQYAGAAALYAPNPLEAALRDLTAASQHVGVNDVAYADYGLEISR